MVPKTMANRLTSLIRTISSVHPVVRSVTSTGPLNLVYFSSQAARCCGTGVGLPMFRKGGKTQLSVCSLMPSVSGTWMISNMSYRKKKKNSWYPAPTHTHLLRIHRRIHRRCDRGPRGCCGWQRHSLCMRVGEVDCAESPKHKQHLV